MNKHTPWSGHTRGCRKIGLCTTARVRWSRRVHSRWHQRQRLVKGEKQARSHIQFKFVSDSKRDNKSWETAISGSKCHLGKGSVISSLNKSRLNFARCVFLQYDLVSRYQCHVFYPKLHCKTHHQVKQRKMVLGNPLIQHSLHSIWFPL